MKDNKLIAEFMGIDTKWANSTDDTYDYHKSWDYLMPVVESCFERLDARDNSADEIKRHLLACHIKGVYQAVVEFIKQYNNG